jgi:hypothetical protein
MGNKLINSSTKPTALERYIQKYRELLSEISNYGISVEHKPMQPERPLLAMN